MNGHKNLRMTQVWCKNLSQSEFAARLNKMEVERQNLAEAVTLAERKFSDEKKKVDELQQQVKGYKSNWESSKQELIDYKQKATRILQVSMQRTSECYWAVPLDAVEASCASVRWLVQVEMGWLTLGSFATQK